MKHQALDSPQILAVEELARGAPAVSAAVLALRGELAAGTMKPVADFSIGERLVALMAGQDAP